MVALPKWPALLVVGEPVSEEDACEILIRTNSSWFNTNDDEWKKQVFQAYGIKFSQDQHGFILDSNQFEVEKELGVLDLSFLDNDRIMSCWIGGPHGWCDWEGRIGSSNYNIGKWPSDERVLYEWMQIAQAFPFLKLKAQLLDRESHEADPKPLVTYEIENGVARQLDEPGEVLCPSTSDLKAEIRALGRPFRERGVNLTHLVEALKITRERKEKRDAEARTDESRSESPGEV